jgi:ABC-type lipoprotein export system ATPase subunit
MKADRLGTTPETKPWMVEAHDLSRIYGDGESIRALDGVDLFIAPGELVAIMGPSGSGKSTLLNILGALDKPSGGEVMVAGQNLAKLSDQDHFRSKTVGFIFQLHNLLPTLTAVENVEVPMTRMKPSAKHQRAMEILDLVDMADRKDHLPSQLSGGQRQRVAIGRALANNPPLVLADEPTGALDTVNGKILMKLLRDLNHSQGTTFVVVTHDPAVARLTNRIIIMRDGKITREDIVGTQLEEDLKMWRFSLLGQQIVGGVRETLEKLSLTNAEIKALQGLLERKKKSPAIPENKDDS